MKYAGKTFTLYASEPVAIQGSDSLYTYQNTGTGTATIQGSNNGKDWITIASVPSVTSDVIAHSYAFLKMVGSTEVSVSRGEAGSTAVSSKNPVPTSAGNFVYVKDTTGATALTASWAKVVTTTTATKSLRMSAACNATTYDIEYTVVTANAAAPTDTRGMALLAGEDFLAGIPVGDIYARSATLQTLVIWSA